MEIASFVLMLKLKDYLCLKIIREYVRLVQYFPKERGKNKSRDQSPFLVASCGSPALSTKRYRSKEGMINPTKQKNRWWRVHIRNRIKAVGIS